MSAVSQPLILALGATLLAVAPGVAAAKGGAFRESAHGRRDTGVLRVTGVPRGECSHCHGAPRNALGDRSDARGRAEPLTGDGNVLCGACHARRSGSWVGEQRYAQSAHGSATSMVWPGPDPRARDPRDAGRCVNCHDPHGVKDARGLVPHLLRVRGAALCLACHSGNPGADVATSLSKTYRHPLVADEPAGPSPAFTPAAASPLANGEAADGSCTACHDAHAAESADGAPQAGAARALAGATRARVSNGPPGAPPMQTLVDRGDPSPLREFEVCFKCHSPAAARPARTAAVAAALNPANASYHPVEAPGRNRAVDRRAFAPGWGPERLVTCSDCHGDDASPTRGPHGSRFPHLLRSRYVARGVDEPALETDLCFSCHAFATYGDPNARDAATLSRFAAHGLHAAKRYSCAWCHDAHGSVEQPSLLALRAPGMIAYTQDRTGGSCTATCHVLTRPEATYVSGKAR